MPSSLEAAVPSITLDDELAHTNPPGSKMKNAISTCLRSWIRSINRSEHIEHSARGIGSGQGDADIGCSRSWSAFPIDVLQRADQIVSSVDVTIEDLRVKGLRLGKIYEKDKSQEMALGEFFHPHNEPFFS